MSPTEELYKAIAITAELTGTIISEAAARVMAEDLARYPEAQILAALTRCRRELKGRLTIADVISRIDDGRPGAEQAWAMMPQSEAQSVVWTDEMAAAFGVAYPLIRAGETVAARMAFLEHYRALVRQARDSGAAVRWTPSLGIDPHGREAVLIEAQRLGRLTAQHVVGLLPHRNEPSPELLKLLPATHDVPGMPRRLLSEAIATAKKDKAA